MLSLVYIVALLGAVVHGARLLSDCSGKCVGEAFQATDCATTDSDCFCAHPAFLDTVNACIEECSPREPEGLQAVQEFCQTVGTAKTDLKRDTGRGGRRKGKKEGWPWNSKSDGHHRFDDHQPHPQHHWQPKPPQHGPPPNNAPWMQPPQNNGLPPMMTQTVLPYPTQTVLPYPTQTVLPYPSNTVLPYPSNTVLPYPSNTVLPYPSNTVLPHPTQTVLPGPAGYYHFMW